MTEPDARRLTGTDDRPIEQIPDTPSTLRNWAELLGGPAIWISHFMIVYLVAEAGCAALDLGEGVLVAFTVVATVIAVLACGALAWSTRRRMQTGDEWTIDFASGGFLLSIGSAFGVLVVGAPALVLSPVC